MRGKGLVLAALVVGVGLGACHKKDQGEAPAAAASSGFEPLKVEVANLKQTQAGCQGEDCPTVDAEWLRFPADPSLSALVERELVTVASEKKQATVAAFAQDYLKDADRRWNITLQTKLLRQQGSLLVLDLAAYDYTGGAHGNPVDRVLNYDRARRKVLSLDDVVQLGQAHRFWQLAQAQHKAWAAPMLKDDPDFLKTWPFRMTDNFMLGEKGLVLKYSAYAIGPYSEGEPEITIPYTQLAGIIRPEWSLK